VANQNTINDDIADAFDEIAHLLETRGDNPFRIRSYRRAARELRALDESIETIVRERGTDGLEDIPGIGDKLAAAIDEYLRSGRLLLLDRLRDQVPPERLDDDQPPVDTGDSQVHGNRVVDGDEQEVLHRRSGRPNEV